MLKQSSLFSQQEIETFLKNENIEKLAAKLFVLFWFMDV